MSKPQLKQFIFDRVTEHLLTQKERAVGYDGRCSYRTGDGKMCAIGCLINSKFYNTSLEGSGVGDSAVVFAISGSLMNYGYQTTPLDFEHMGCMLVQLQDIHDQQEVSDWPHFLKSLANQEGLEFNPPEPPSVLKTD